MAGLDVIISQIDNSSKEKIEQIKADSDRECSKIINEATQEAEKRLAEAKTRAQNESADIENRADSTAQLKIRQTLLSCKQKLISDTIKKAKETLLSKDVSEYFDILVKIAAKYGRGETGEIILSKNDKNRLPADFENRVNSALADKKGSLKLSADTADINGGFILKYSQVEENCSIDALFDNSYDVLVDKVNEVLFSK